MTTEIKCKLGRIIESVTPLAGYEVKFLGTKDDDVMFPLDIASDQVFLISAMSRGLTFPVMRSYVERLAEINYEAPGSVYINVLSNNPEGWLGMADEDSLAVISNKDPSLLSKFLADLVDKVARENYYERILNLNEVVIDVVKAEWTDQKHLIKSLRNAREIVKEIFPDVEENKGIWKQIVGSRLPSDEQIIEYRSLLSRLSKLRAICKDIAKPLQVLEAKIKADPVHVWINSTLNSMERLLACYQDEGIEIVIIPELSGFESEISDEQLKDLGFIMENMANANILFIIGVHDTNLTNCKLLEMTEKARIVRCAFIAPNRHSTTRVLGYFDICLNGGVNKEVSREDSEFE